MSSNLHQVVYAIFAIAHVASSFGLHEIFVSVLLAMGYAVLAATRT